MDRIDTTITILRKKARNEELRVCYMNIILGNEVKADEAVRRVSYMGEERNAYRGLVVNQKEEHGMILIKRILKNIIGWSGLDLSGSEQRQVYGIYEHGNEPSHSTKCGQSLN